MNSLLHTHAHSFSLMYRFKPFLHDRHAKQANDALMDEANAIHDHAARD